MYYLYVKLKDVDLIFAILVIALLIFSGIVITKILSGEFL